MATNDKSFSNFSAFDKFFTGAKKIVDNHYDNMFKDDAQLKYTLDYTVGQKYIKLVLVRKSDSTKKPTSVFAFVDKATGDVLKAATFNAPAKGERGNINNPDHGLSRITAYGAGYNR